MIKDPLLWVMAAAIFVLLILYIRAINQLDSQDKQRRFWKFTATKWASRAIQYNKEYADKTRCILIPWHQLHRDYRKDFNKDYEGEIQ